MITTPFYSPTARQLVDNSVWIQTYACALNYHAVEEINVMDIYVLENRFYL